MTLIGMTQEISGATIRLARQRTNTQNTIFSFLPLEFTPFLIVKYFQTFEVFTLLLDFEEAPTVVETNAHAL